jgi:hypothetical protein
MHHIPTGRGHDRPIKRIDFIQNYLDGIFAEDLHA